MTTRTFDSAPPTAPLLLKAALPALPLLGGLPGIRHHGTAAPELTLVRERVTTDVRHLGRYNEVCGFGPSNELPATYPHMAAFALHMTLMNDTAFPFTPMGLVHLRNRITQVRPIDVSEPYAVSVRAADLRTHPKGRLIDLLTDVTVDGETVWTEVTTLFSRGSGAGTETKPAPLEGLSAPEGVIRWKLGGDLGRRYGAVSGDRNPIHLHPLTAKPFGFSRNIAHGMWTKARALATLSNRLPGAFTVDVEFRKPILLPATVIFGSRTGEHGIDFGVTSDKPPSGHEPGGQNSASHLVGRVTSTSTGQ